MVRWMKFSAHLSPPTPYTYFSKSQDQSVFYDNIVVKCFHGENTMFLP